MPKSRIWAIGCALTVIVSIALGWVLGASPLLATAKSADEAREAAEAQNASYSQELVILKDQFEGIDQLEDQLDDLRQELPTAAALPDYLRQLSTEAQQHSVSLTSITTADAVAYAPTTAEAPVAEPPAADAEAPAAEAAAPQTDGAAAPPAEGAGVPVTSSLVTAENFIAIPITLAFDGGYDNVLAFVEGLQKGTRLTAVTALSTTKDAAEAPTESEDANSPATPLATDAVSGTLSMLIYVLLDPTAAG
jgi:Tfp pilus assembly protein PilO